MHLLYVDESGDTGKAGSQTDTFVLSGLLIHHAEWHEAQAAVLRMRQRVWEKYGYPLHAEMHASEMLGRSPEHYGLKRSLRIQSVLDAVEMIRLEQKLLPIRVIITKSQTTQDIAQTAWTAMLNATKEHLHSSQPHAQCRANGLAVICYDHRTAPSASWLQQIRPQLSLENLLIDEPFGRDSKQSAILQPCDLLAYLTKQANEPSMLFRQNHAQKILGRCQRIFDERGMTLRHKEEGGAIAPP